MKGTSTGGEVGAGGSSCIRGCEEEGGGKDSGERGLTVRGSLFVIRLRPAGVMGKSPQDRIGMGVSLRLPSWGALRTHGRPPSGGKTVTAERCRLCAPGR